MEDDGGNDVVKTTSYKEGMRWKMRGNVVVIMVGGVFQIINI